VAHGRLDAVDHGDRENRRKIFGDYQPPPMDEAVDEALLAYIAKRRKEIGGVA
jgi:trimethylamine:corrinoid methyltransferase-like protein